MACEIARGKKEARRNDKEGSGQGRRSQKEDISLEVVFLRARLMRRKVRLDCVYGWYGWMLL